MTKRFHELVIEAPYPEVRAFLAGYFVDRKVGGELIFSRDAGIKRKTLGDRLREILGGHGPLTHVVVDADLVDSVKQALGNAPENLKLEIVSDRVVTEACFDFSFQAYARLYAEEIRDALAGLSPGVRLENYDSEENFDPDAEGPEAYAPAHDYSFSGEGRAVGPLPGVLDLHRRLGELSLVKTGYIDLSFE